jgi:hypothetical protein
MIDGLSERWMHPGQFGQLGEKIPPARALGAAIHFLEGHDIHLLCANHDGNSRDVHLAIRAAGVMNVVGHHAKCIGIGMGRLGEDKAKEQEKSRKKASHRLNIRVPEHNFN